MDKYFEPRQIIIIFIRWWWVLVLGTLSAVAIGYSITQNQIRVYRATATVMVGGFIQAPQISRDDLVGRDAFTQAYAEMALRQPVLDGVVDALDLRISWRQLKDTVGIEIVESTPLIEISAEASTPQDAQAIAAEIANQLILLSQAQDIENATREFMQQEVEDLQLRIENGRERLATLQVQTGRSLSEGSLNELTTEIDTLQRLITDWEDT